MLNQGSTASSRKGTLIIKTETFPWITFLLVQSTQGDQAQRLKQMSGQVAFSLAVVASFGMHSPAYAQHQKSGHLVVSEMERAIV